MLKMWNESYVNFNFKRTMHAPVSTGLALGAELTPTCLCPGAELKPTRRRPGADVFFLARVRTLVRKQCSLTRVFVCVAEPIISS